jgi:hypothetical protein
MQRIYRTASANQESAGPELVLEVDGRLLDLSGWLADAAPGAPRTLIELAAHGFFERASLESALKRGRWRELTRPTQVLVPVEPERVGKILALGKNFREHAAEFGEAVPEEPLFFNKLPETLRAHGESVRVPAWYTARVDHEAELAVVIGKQGWEIDETRAMEHVAGYSVANDLTARTLQKQDRPLLCPARRARHREPRRHGPRAPSRRDDRGAPARKHPRPDRLRAAGARMALAPPHAARGRHRADGHARGSRPARRRR